MKIPEQTRETWRKIGHEPTSFGYAFDDRDKDYIDIQISLKWSPKSDGIHPEDKKSRKNDVKYSCQYGKYDFGCLFVAFTTEQSFYFPTRDSSPVIGRRFNPEIFLRFWRPNRSYIDIGFNHESNGQSIDTEDEFIAKQNELSMADRESPEQAKEYLNRNWNYWEITNKLTKEINSSYFKRLHQYLILRHFFDGAEEAYSFEPGFRDIERSEVDGLRTTFRFDGNCNSQTRCWWRKFAYSYNTGIKKTFQFDSHQIEWGFYAGGLPITISYYKGYNEDLIDYYRNVARLDVSFEVVGF